MQEGYVFKKGNSWFLRYRENVTVDGKTLRKQKCVKLADYCDRYRREKDLEDLISEKMGKVRESAKCSHAGVMFTEYVKDYYLPFVQRTKKPSTYSGRKTYLDRYIIPRVQKLALRDFTTATIYKLLEQVTTSYSLNTDTVAKVRSIIHHVFMYATNTGAFIGQNPAEDVLIPESASTPEPTEAATLEEVKAILSALKDELMARAAVAIMANTGIRPGEARGLRWEEWDRKNRRILVARSVWHKEVGTPKTKKTRFVAVEGGLPEILEALWNEQGCPISGYILRGVRKTKSGIKDHPIILDNLAKRVIRPALEKAKEGMEQAQADLLTWKGWYSLRRFHGTDVTMESDAETGANALGNSKAVLKKHYLKPTDVLPAVRQAVKVVGSRLVQ